MADDDEETLGNDEPFGNVAETHSAVIFFAGSRAYKLKKPVDLGFLDFTTAKARAVACARETELNRRFAPDVYLGVAEVRGPGAREREPLVVMRRMPAARRLSALVRAKADVAGPLRQVARILAAQHAAAPRSGPISEQGTAEALSGRWRTTSGRHGRGAAVSSRPASSRRLACWPAGSSRAGDHCSAARIDRGHVLDGHGDLLADDIYSLDDGPRILDCLDFDDRLRWVDRRR